MGISKKLLLHSRNYSGYFSELLELASFQLDKKDSRITELEQENANLRGEVERLVEEGFSLAESLAGWRSRHYGADKDVQRDVVMRGKPHLSRALEGRE